MGVHVEVHRLAFTYFWMPQSSEKGKVVGDLEVRVEMLRHLHYTMNHKTVCQLYFNPAPGTV